MKSNTYQQNKDKAQDRERRPCKLVRRRLFGQVSVRDSSLWARLGHRPGIDFETPWVQNHISACPRCQKRFAAMNKVDLAFTLLRSQPHAKHLLSQANTQTVDVLQRKLRKTEKAHTLKSALPGLSVPGRIHLLHQSFAHVAACIAILFLSKIGIFSTIKNSQLAGRRAVKHLYANHLDADTTDEMFPQV